MSDKKETLKKPYDHKSVEKEIEFNFSASAQSEKPQFSIIMPPPNVTGTLHMGHALVNTIQDILTRFHRLNGAEALWVPGTDHAGIATQSVVEKKLFAETGKKRADFSREEFLSHVEAWKDLCKGKIVNQIKKLGTSADWSKERFSLDDQATNAVKTVFKKMFDDGLIYRGDYLVNWDTHLGTAIADDEVEYEEKDGFLWHFAYPIDGSDEKIVIATTRPETMLGDTAVAVNGSDDRYKHLIGKMIKLPLSDRLIPIIEDHYVDKEFGTGAVKITPAHDFNDYEVGSRHDLPMINVMNGDGTMNENAGTFNGMSVQDARANVVESMKELGLLEKIEPHKNRVGVSYRSKSIIEPLLSKQWFLKMEPFKEKLLSAIFDEKIMLVPKEWEKTYRHWIENIRDWCISRQLWWGHRIPIWYEKDNEENVICYVGDDLPPEVKANPDKYRQEEDVLDTWFSSALWPLTCLGWPNKTAELEKFYPTSVLVTGHDILFFWVARMIMMGEYAAGQVPFKKIFLHGLIFAKSYWRKDSEGNINYLHRDEWMNYERGEKVPKDVSFKWEKMSKSKGNIIDPLDIIDEYGTDALRLALTLSVTTAKQIDLDFRKFEESKNFCNKLWNASSFVIQNLGDTLENHFDESAFKLEDRWILSKLSKTIKQMHENIEAFQFSHLANSLYHFFWDDFCAYYLEICKPYLYGKAGSETEINNKKWILVSVLNSTLNLFSSITPYITTEIRSILSDITKNFDIPNHPLTNSLKEESLPTFDLESSDAESAFEEIQETLHTIRNIRGDTNIPPGERVKIHIEDQTSTIADNEEILSALTKIDCVEYHKTMPAIDAPSSMANTAKRKIMVLIPESLLAKEKERLQKTLDKTLKNLENTKRQLSNEAFVERAPKHLIEEKQNLLKMLEQNKTEIEEKLGSF